MEDVVVGHKFKIVRKIGVGSSSEIFEGVDIQSGEQVAIKREHVKVKHPRLLNESKLYLYLQGGVGIPSFKWFGVEGEYRFLVIQLLGSSLEDLLKQRDDEGHFSLKTVLMLADQIIDTISYMHEKDVIHREIKPGHLLMGVGSNVNKVYLIDFGRAKFYIDPALNEHIPYREDISFVGSYRYASLYTHFGMEQSRRDDAVSFCFVLMYLLHGCVLGLSLSWQGLIEGDDKEEYSLDLSNSKYKYTGPEELDKMYPPEFAKCLSYARVQFYATPFFLSMKSTLRQLFIREGYDFDYVYDWTTFPEDDIKLGTSSEKPKRSLATLDSSSDHYSRNMHDFR